MNRPPNQFQQSLSDQQVLRKDCLNSPYFYSSSHFNSFFSTGPGDTHGCFNPIEYVSETNPSFNKTGGSTKHGTSRSFGTSREFGATGSSGGSLSRTQGHTQKQFVQPPFRPASPNKTGVLGTLAPFPEYISSFFTCHHFLRFSLSLFTPSLLIYLCPLSW